jgi:hypothetical protein
MVDMDEKLGSIFEKDHGFAQFVDRKGLVASDPRSRIKYKIWQMELWFQLKQIEEARAEGFEIGKARAMEERKAEHVMEFVLNAFRKVPVGESLTPTAKKLRSIGLADAIVDSARSQVETERG